MDDSIAELCRREGITRSLYHSWSKEFMEAGELADHLDTKEMNHGRGAPFHPQTQGS